MVGSRRKGHGIININVILCWLTGRGGYGGGPTVGGFGVGGANGNGIFGNGGGVGVGATNRYLPPGGGYGK